MATNLEIGGAVKRTQKGSTDWYYGGDNEAWADLASAKAGVPAAIRPGKTVGVKVSGLIMEYWWPDATHIADSDLIIKTSPLPQALGITDSPTFLGLTVVDPAVPGNTTFYTGNRIEMHNGSNATLITPGAVGAYAGSGATYANLLPDQLYFLNTGYKLTIFAPAVALMADIAINIQPISGTLALLSDITAGVAGGELQANKATDLSSNDDVHYPTVKAVKTATDAEAGARASAISAEATARSSADSAEATLRSNGDTATLTSAQAYADSLLVSVYIDCGNWDASTGLFPTTGGTGTSGAIKKGNAFEVSVAGTIGGQAFDVGDIIRALVNTPGQTQANWAASEHNTQQATQTTRGTLKLATQATAIAATDDLTALTPLQALALIQDQRKSYTKSSSLNGGTPFLNRFTVYYINAGVISGIVAAGITNILVKTTSGGTFAAPSLPITILAASTFFVQFDYSNSTDLNGNITITGKDN
jgi:hypothetical protein